MQLISRAEWGARPRGKGAVTPFEPKGCAVHWEGAGWAWPWDHSTCDDKVRNIQAFHMDTRGWSDIAYNFLACPHGYVFEGRGLNRRSAANGDETSNTYWYAVQCMWGSNSGSVTADLLNAARDAIDYCRIKGGAGLALRGHRDFKSTDCPGDQLYAWVHAGAPRPNTPEDDMQFTDAVPGLTDADGSEVKVGEALARGNRAYYEGPIEGSATDKRLDRLEAVVRDAPAPPADASAEVRLAALEAFVAKLKGALE